MLARAGPGTSSYGLIPYFYPFTPGNRPPSKFITYSLKKRYDYDLKESMLECSQDRTRTYGVKLWKKKLSRRLSRFQIIRAIFLTRKGSRNMKGYRPGVQQRDRGTQDAGKNRQETHPPLTGEYRRPPRG